MFTQCTWHLSNKTVIERTCFLHSHSFDPKYMSWAKPKCTFGHFFLVISILYHTIILLYDSGASSLLSNRTQFQEPITLSCFTFLSLNADLPLAMYLIKLQVWRKSSINNKEVCSIKQTNNSAPYQVSSALGQIINRTIFLYFGGVFVMMSHILKYESPGIMLLYMVFLHQQILN